MISQGTNLEKEKMAKSTLKTYFHQSSYEFQKVSGCRLRHFDGSGHFRHLCMKICYHKLPQMSNFGSI